MVSQHALATHFATLRDPRRTRGRKHNLLDIVTLAICAVVCGADDWQQIETFAKAQHDWFRRFLELPGGIPSHDTFERVFSALHPAQFERCFRLWACSLTDKLGIKHIVIDGKTVRGRGCPAEMDRLHLVSAWCDAHKLSLAQVATDTKSNEITAIPQLLKLLHLHGAIVSIDAQGCQKHIAQAIVDAGADYVLTLKANQPGLLERVEAKIVAGYETDHADMGVDRYSTHERAHGRVEYRSYMVLTDMSGIDPDGEWPELKVIGVCYSEREVHGKVSEELRYFIGSRVASAMEYAGWVRGHWGIENSLHWQLDVTFSEDYSRERDHNCQQNLALIRKMAINVLKRHKSKKSMACKRLQAAVDVTFREEVLQEVLNPATCDA